MNDLNVKVSNLESCGTPVNKLDGPLGLDGCDGVVDVLGDHVASVEHAAGHVLAVPGVALHHLVGGLEAGVCHLGHTELLMERLSKVHMKRGGREREMAMTMMMIMMTEKVAIGNREET